MVAAWVWLGDDYSLVCGSCFTTATLLWYTLETKFSSPMDECSLAHLGKRDFPSVLGHAQVEPTPTPWERAGGLMMMADGGWR